MFKPGVVEESQRSSEIPAPSHIGGSAEAYAASGPLAEAVNVSLVLGQPLLVTGEPGCGKTQLAASIAWQLRLSYERFDTKSTSTARDLFYTFDALGRFYDAQVQVSLLESERKKVDVLNYIRLQALGRAILDANPASSAARLVDRTVVENMPRRTVVLIDEIDKAPRDFPNDLLNEIESMSFRIPELENLQISAPHEMRPVVVITSNSEKNLPEPFLRRCVYHHIEFPDRDLERIVEAHLFELAPKPQWLPDALKVFRFLRLDASGLEKKPATAELLAWIVALQQLGTDEEVPLRDQLEKVIATSGVLAKSMRDRGRIGVLVQGCLKSA